MANDIDSVLGKNITSYGTSYNPAILAREARVGNRKIYGFDNESLPFAAGRDIWHAYEANFLLNNGLPINGVLKLSIPFNSEFIVESKSLKLYLFSFNMEKLGETEDVGTREFLTRVVKDLSNLLGTEDVQASFYNEGLSEAWCETDELLSKATPLYVLANLEETVFDQFTENPNILQASKYPELGGVFVKTDLLRSNCKITHQPDYGTLFIKMRTQDGIVPTAESLAQYIVSMRSENHFHEEIVECVYSRLWNKFKPVELMVTALYTRRGGIDICPTRASHEDLLPQQLIDINVLTPKEYRS